MKKFLLCMALLPIACGARPEPAVEKAASEASLAWLSLLDSRQYEATWDQAAPLFQAGVSKTDWARVAAGVREPLGAVQSRTLDDANLLTSVPGGPDGQYVVLSFRSNFEHKAKAVETITPMLDDKGVWRVAGYYIR